MKDKENKLHIPQELPKFLSMKVIDDIFEQRNCAMEYHGGLAWAHCPLELVSKRREMWEGHLAHKWGIQHTLPEQHPYKYAKVTDQCLDQCKNCICHITNKDTFKQYLNSKNYIARAL